MVLDDLRDAGAEVGDGGEVAEDGGAEGCGVVGRGGGADGDGFPGPGAVGEVPGCGAGEVDGEDGEGVFDCFAGGGGGGGGGCGLLFGDGVQGVGGGGRAVVLSGTAVGGRGAATASAAWETEVLVRDVHEAPTTTLLLRTAGNMSVPIGGTITQEWSLLATALCFPPLFLLLVSRLSFPPLIPQTLRDQHAVGEGEVYRQRNDGWNQSGPHRAYQIGDIAKRPDEEEGQGDTLGVALRIVLP